MNPTKNTILITGGGSGIGFEMAKLFSENDNQVIIVGRNEDRLRNAAAKFKNVAYIASDVTKKDEISSIVNRIKIDFPDLNILINNAGRAFVHNLAKDVDAFEKAEKEILTNYLSVIRLNEILLPILSKQQDAAIVNVSSIAAFIPGSDIPSYAASKAALHSYTQSLRISLERSTSIKVFELMPPLVDTEFSKEIGGSNGIHPSVVAKDLLNAMAKDVYEIHVGQTADLYRLFLSSPEEALKVMNNRS